MNATVLIPVGEPRLAFRYGQQLEHPKMACSCLGLSMIARIQRNCASA